MQAPSINYKNSILYLLFAIYVIVIIFGAINHESWGDEAQSWLLVKDLDLAGLFKALPAEGHPPLWYLVLYPFAKLGCPYETVKFAAAAFSTGAVFLLLFKTNVNFFLKIAIPFSYYFMYLYAIFGRSYPLILFFLMAVISVYPRRFEKPWLFALCIVGLFNTHMHMFSFTATLAGLFCIDALQYKKPVKKMIAPIILMFAGGLYLLPYLGSSPMSDYFKNTITDHTSNILITLTNGLLLITKVLAPGLLLFLILAGFLLTRPKAFLLLAGGLAGVFYIMAFRYSYIQPRHYGIFTLIVLGSYCIAEFYKDDPFNLRLKKDYLVYGQRLLAITIALQIPAGLMNYKRDIDGLYSDSKNVADFILNNNLEHSVIVGYHTWSALAVLPYMPDDVSFYDPKCDRFNRHYIYDTCFTDTTQFKPERAITITVERMPQKLDSVILLLSYKINNLNTNYLELLYSTEEDPMYAQEEYFVYRFVNIKRP